MIHRFNVACALWHPRLPDSAIRPLFPQVVPQPCWSAGDVNPATGLARNRTYCRFDLGEFSQEQIAEAINLLPGKEDVPAGCKVAVYIKGIDEAPELVLDNSVLLMIANIGGSIVIR